MHSPKQSISTALIAFVLLALVPATAVAQSQAQEITQNAWNSLQQGQIQLQDALKEFDKAIELSEGYAPAWYFRGMVLANMQQLPDAHESFMKAAELNPGWGQAHQMSAFSALDTGKIEVAWEQTIKAHQAGVDMAQLLQRLEGTGGSPDDLDAQLAAVRVFVGPIDTENFEQAGDTALQAGASGSGSARTDVGRRVVQEVQGELFQLQQRARVSFSDSHAFGLVQRQEMAQYIMVVEVDSISDTQRAGSNSRTSANRRRRLRGYVKLLDAQSGEEAFKRRVDFRDIASAGDVNRDFETLMGYLEEWAAQRAG